MMWKKTINKFFKNIVDLILRKWGWGVLGGLLIFFIVMGWFLIAPSTSTSSGTTFVVRRGPLRISVIEGGTVEAAASQVSKSEIKGQTKILSIIEEGYQVTEDDVREGKVLVRLDDSQLLEQKTQQEMQYQTALAQYTEAKEQYEIQVKQNESDIKAAELEVKFARMDFEKYLGTQVASQILGELETTIKALVESVQRDAYAPTNENASSSSPAINSSTTADLQTTNLSQNLISASIENTSLPNNLSEPRPTEAQSEAGETSKITESLPPLAISVDFSKYADPDLLGDGEAQQKLKTLQNARMLAEEELKLAETNFLGTQRLKEKNFVTQQELDADEMKVKRLRNAYESAQIEENLFIKYEFPKQAEKLLSSYLEALRKLERTAKQARSRLAQAEAKWRSAEATFLLQKTKRDDVLEQIEKCVIRAERPGLVVYAGSNQPWRSERIEEGAIVREGQEIITIPDMTQMTVIAKVHESSIKKIQKGQKAIITLDAFPDEVLQGEVSKVSVLPDSSMRWMNPDIKQYPVTITIEGIHDWLKPGLTAKCEIIIKELDNVLYVPIQAVSNVNGERVCYVINAVGLTEPRSVKTGEMSADFVEILEGLQEGETVLLRAPSFTEEKAEQPGTKPSNGVSTDSSK